MTDRDLATLLGVRQVADLLGVAPGTVRGYLSRGQMPAADTTVLGRPLWRPETIKAWHTGRRSRA